jgi:hypothetical protein
VSVVGNRGRLASSAKDLSHKWAETKNYWRDRKCEEFEGKYLQELFAQVNRTLTVMEKLEEILKKVRTDCE